MMIPFCRIFQIALQDVVDDENYPHWEDRKFCWGTFLFGSRNLRRIDFANWTIFKAKNNFCKNWTLIKIKISMVCVHKGYELKGKMVQEMVHNSS